ncbi:Mitochondrial distribution and morphology protein 35 [Cyberlindnera fabianii]|uniref:Mitochondrial distribution and morphology protein 35 n=1 Tax=Cyberlindnera fabianii TaxID=36022 RepID=A0A1V2L643_CYBFA|nr:Mitochondrial distribution and morphology protein 35 [Cyberlindnera fabianii]
MGNAMSSSLAPECTEAKKEYDDCFNNWYSEKFLKGKSLHNECEDLWYDYKACVDLALAKQGILPMLEEAREDAPFDNGGVPEDKEKK